MTVEKTKILEFINEFTAKSSSATEHTEKKKEKNSKTLCPLRLNNLFAVESQITEISPVDYGLLNCQIEVVVYGFCEIAEERVDKAPNVGDGVI